MKFRSVLKTFFLLILAAAILAGAYFLISKHYPHPQESEEKAEKKETGEGVITFDQALQGKNGIVVGALESAAHFTEIIVQGIVISHEDLQEFEKHYPDRKPLDTVSVAEILIEIATPPKLPLSDVPDVVWVKNSDGTFFQAKQIFSFRRLDSHKRKMDFIYSAPARETVVEPGTIFFVHLPVEPKLEGVFVPNSAVILFEGKSWIYAEKDPEHFVRREISTQIPAEDGWFVSEGLSTKDKIVTKGAQILLSREFHSEIPEE